MSDAYLWDRTGIPDLDEVRLEAELGRYGLRHTDHAFPTSSPHRRRARRVLAGGWPLAMAAAIVFGVGGLVAGLSISGSDTLTPQPEVIVSPPEAPPAVGGPGSTVVPGDAGTSSRPGSAVATPTAAPTPALNPYRPRSKPLAAPTASSRPRLPARKPPSDIVNPWGDPPSKSKAAGLSSREVQRVVSRNKASIARICWGPGDRSKAGTVRVVVSLTISPSGRVDAVSATSTGDDAVRGRVARCVRSQVEGWTFPEASKKTTVNVPFVFTGEKRLVDPFY